MTRPGLAAIASALLVELTVSILQHPLGPLAPGALNPSSSSSTSSEDRGGHPLGIVPHQIRGFLHNFENKIIKGRSYDCCSACSDKIVQAYKQDGWEFVKKALNEKGYVEELSGLAEVSLFFYLFAGRCVCANERRERLILDRSRERLSELWQIWISVRKKKWAKGWRMMERES